LQEETYTGQQKVMRLNQKPKGVGSEDFTTQFYQTYRTIINILNYFKKLKR
jgi:hypothetical protein